MPTTATTARHDKVRRRAMLRFTRDRSLYPLGLLSACEGHGHPQLTYASADFLCVCDRQASCIWGQTDRLGATEMTRGAW
jgi:hypothetical protein